MILKLILGIILTTIGIGAILSFFYFVKERDPAWLCLAVLFAEIIYHAIPTK